MLEISKTQTICDEAFMQRALQISLNARINAPPNPWVGCVIVKNGYILSEGYTQPNGGPHAETIALQAAGDQAEGSDMFVTLEPCSHYGRTPPCAEALIRKKIKRVIIGIEDPDPLVQGRGMNALRQAGIQVTLGVLEREIKNFLTPYLKHRKTGIPYCLAKGAISIDGRTAAQDYTSKWISCPEARADAHLLRAESQAILIGTGTAFKDNPALTVRDTSQIPLKQPLRVILDAHGRIEPTFPLFDAKLAPTLVFTSNACNQKTLKKWGEAGASVEIIPMSDNNRHLNLFDPLKILGKKGIVQLLIEGGPTLLNSFFQEKLIDRFVVYVGPRLLGDNGIPLFNGFKVNTIDDAPLLKLIESKKCGHSMRLDYEF